MQDLAHVAGAAGGIFAYLLLWGTGWFGIRTGVFLLLLLRFLGQRWGAAAICSGILTAFALPRFRFRLERLVGMNRPNHPLTG